MTNKLFDFNTNSWQEVEIQPFDMEYYLQQKPTLTTGQYAQHVGVSSKTIRQWCREGKLKSTRTPGGHNRFSLDSFYSEDATIYKLPYGQQ